MVIFLWTCFFSLVLTPIVIKVANRYGLVDDPRKRYHPAQTHVGVVPRAGGLSIYSALLIAVILFLPFSIEVLGLLVAGGIAVAVGIWDDYHDVSPYVRLVTNALVAAIVILVGIGNPFITNPFGGILHLDTIQIVIAGVTIPVIWWIASVSWIVWMMNAIGWSAGVDGQLPGFVVIASLVIALLAMRFVDLDPEQGSVVSLALMTAGAFAGFLPWNFYPQKIMPGYGGKSLAGLMLAVLAISSSTKIGTTLLVLSVPLVDAGYTLLRRLVKRKSPFQADRGHLHHLLLDLGWDKRKIALFYWSVTAIMGIIALLLNSRGKVLAFSIAVVAIGAVLVLLTHFRSTYGRKSL